MQRLSTLFGVLTFGEHTRANRYNVVYDFEAKRFYGGEDENHSAAYVNLGDLFSPHRLLAAQQRLSQHYDGAKLVDDLVNLHSKFQEYMIPLVTIHTSEVSEVVRIFERINSTGTKLGAVDFMRAATWSQHFDLNSELERISVQLDAVNFGLEDETIVKALAVVLGSDPSPDALISLRDIDSRKLIQGTELVADVLLRVAEFLREELNIYSSEYVPYEGIVLVLSRVCAQTWPLKAQSRRRVAAWVWATGFSEALRGKPDHYVARAMRMVERSVRDNQEMQIKLTLSPGDLLERRFTKGRALSSTIAALFATHGARSLLSGELIEPSTFMTEFSSQHFLPLVRSLPLPKAIANIFVATEDDARAWKASGRPVGFLFNDFDLGQVDARTRASQFITDEAVDALRRGDTDGFIVSRAVEMYEVIRSTVSIEN